MQAGEKVKEVIQRLKSRGLLAPSETIVATPTDVREMIFALAEVMALTKLTFEDCDSGEQFKNSRLGALMDALLMELCALSEGTTSAALKPNIIGQSKHHGTHHPLKMLMQWNAVGAVQTMTHIRPDIGAQEWQRRVASILQKQGVRKFGQSAIAKLTAKLERDGQLILAGNVFLSNVIPTGGMSEEEHIRKLTQIEPTEFWHLAQLELIRSAALVVQYDAEREKSKAPKS